MKIEQLQKNVCEKYNLPWVASPDNMKVGIAKNVKNGILPINGLRHQQVGDTTGWYIWAGEEWSDDPNFFVPIHVQHLDDWNPEIKKYLGLPPGSRFLIADEHEDIWQDPALLNE